METTIKTNLPVLSEGRLPDGPLFIFDLPLLMEKITNEVSWKKGQRNAITLFKSDGMRLVLIALRDGAEIDFRQSGNLISLQLLKGKLKFTTEKQTVELTMNQILTMHENIQHSLIAIEETIFLLTVGNSNSDIIVH